MLDNEHIARLLDLDPEQRQASEPTDVSLRDPASLPKNRSCAKSLGNETSPRLVDLNAQSAIEPDANAGAINTQTRNGKGT